MIATVALISACGSTAPATSTSDRAATDHAKAAAFAQCMRHNGVSAFPDPPASGDLTVDGVANGSAVDTNTPVFTRAVSACKTLEPAGFTGRKPTSQQASARLAFARCMRQNGVPDFPDPTPDGPLIDTNRIPSLAGKDPRTDPAFNSARDKCSSFATAAGVVSQ